MGRWRIAQARQAISLAVGLTIGFVAGFKTPMLFAPPTVSTDWMQTTLPGKHFGMSFTSEVMAAELPYPEFTSVAAKVKFTMAAVADDFTQLGYLIEYETAHADKSKFPERYKHDKKVNWNGTELTALAIDEVSFTMVPHIQLLDKDNFVLANIEGKEETVESGAHETIREIAPDRISAETAMRVTHAVVTVQFTTCITCGW